MNELLDLTIGFDEGTLDERETIRFAALLLYTGLVYSVGRYGRLVNDLIESGYVDAIAADLHELRNDPLSVLGVTP